MDWTDITRRQAGLITRRQLRATGVPATTIDTWLQRRSRIERTSIDGVYRLVGVPSARGESAWLAALGARSPVSYVSAAAWWDMPVEDDGWVHVTRFDRRRLDWPEGVRVHRVAIARDAIECHQGLWVTTRSETALDCIGWLSPGRAKTFADRAFQQGWCDLSSAARRLETRRWGNRQLRRITERMGDQAQAESERRLHRLLRAAAITGWVAQFPFVAAGRRFEIDIAFPQHRLAIEVDGYAYHSREGRFQTDRTKQNALIAAGWRILRFTWADLDERPGEVIAQILQVLAA